MARVLVPCPNCRSVNVPSQDITLQFHQGALIEHAWSYRYRCPRCAQLITTPLRHHRHRTDLQSICGQVQIIGRPAELDEPRTGLAITADDVLDFHLDLRHDHAVAAELDRYR